MKEFILKREDLISIFQLLSREYEVYGPKFKSGEGHLSDTAVTDYALLENFDELCWDKKAAFSPKEFFLPVTEEIMVFNGNGATPSLSSISPKVLFLRPCETHAIKRMDAHFRNGFKDPNYEKRRNTTYLFVIECTQSWDSCFCQTMETDKAERFDLLIRKVNDDQYRVAIGNEKFDNLFLTFKELQSEEEEHSPVENSWNVGLPEIDESVNSFQVWKEYGKRCIGCGKCNFVCPTCFCFTMRDETREDGTIVRQRVWSSCQVKGFAMVAGGYEYRKDQADKGRFKFLHKFKHFKDVHGVNLCVGCGRCVEACPEFIDIRVNMTKVNLESKLINMREDDESLYTKSS